MNLDIHAALARADGAAGEAVPSPDVPAPPLHPRTRRDVHALLFAVERANARGKPALESDLWHGRTLSRRTLSRRTLYRLLQRDTDLGRYVRRLLAVDDGGKTKALRLRPEGEWLVARLRVKGR